MPRKVQELLSRAEDFLYIATAAILILAAALLLGYSGFNFLVHLDENLTTRISHLLDGLLLVLMLVEILHTVGIFLTKRRLVIEPFLAVGIIAVIRRVLIITAEQVHPTTEHADIFRMTMLELGLLAIMILVFVFCIFLLHRHGRETPMAMEE